MRAKNWLMIALMAALSGAAHAVEVCWTNPTTLTDGTPITNLREVMLYWSKVDKPATCARLAQCSTWPTGNLLTLTSVTGAKVCAQVNEAPGTYFVVATARLGNEEVSDFSNTKSAIVPNPRPRPPTLVQSLDPVCTAGTDCSKIAANSVAIIASGTPVWLRWKPVETESIETEVRLYRTDARVAGPKVLGVSGRWRWTPSVPGLYYATARVCSSGACSEWTGKAEQQWIYHVD